MNLTQLEEEIRTKFNRARYKEYALACHPDLQTTPEDKVKAGELFKLLQDLMDDKPQAVLLGKYKIGRKLFEGSISDIYQCEKSFLKVALSSQYNSYIKSEINIIKTLNEKAGNKIYSRMIPSLRDEVTIDRRTGFIYDVEGSHTLSHWKSLDDRHVAWMVKRVLSCLGFVHTCGTIHGNINSEHILINHKEHGCSLIGWDFAGKSGYSPKKVPFKEGRPDDKQYTVETDIYMVASTFLPYVQNTHLINFLNSCLLSKRLRPADAWSLHDEWDTLLKRVFGKPKFVELEI